VVSPVVVGAPPALFARNGAMENDTTQARRRSVAGNVPVLLYAVLKCHRMSEPEPPLPLFSRKPAVATLTVAP